MFRKSQTSQLELFESPSNLLSKRASKKCDNPKAWHNQFFKLVNSQVNEDNFAPLFKDTLRGASESILKEEAGAIY